MAGMAADDQHAEQLDQHLGGVEADARPERHEHVQPLLAAGLRKPASRARRAARAELEREHDRVSNGCSPTSKSMVRNRSSPRSCSRLREHVERNAAEVRDVDERVDVVDQEDALALASFGSISSSSRSSSVRIQSGVPGGTLHW